MMDLTVSARTARWWNVPEPPFPHRRLAWVGGLLTIHLLLVMLTHGRYVCLPIDVKPVLGVLYGPLIYGVCVVSTSSSASSSWRGLILVGLVGFIAWVQAAGMGGIDHGLGLAVRVGVYGFTAFWLIRSLRMLFRHVSSGGRELSWLYHAVLLFSLLTAVGFVDLVRVVLWPGADQGMVVGAILVLGVAVVGVALFRRFLYPTQAQPALGIELANPEVRPGSQELATRVLVLFEEEDIFLNPRLSVADVGDRLGVKPYAVSRALNRQLGQSFPAFVRAYRVERAKALLSGTTLKLHAVALDSGFANTTSFHRTFRRATGMTPSAHRRKEMTHPDTIREL